MSKNDLAPGSKAQLIQRILGRKTGQAASDGRMAEQSATRQAAASHIPESFTRFDRHPGYEKMLVPKAMADRMGVRNPFFRSHDGV
ncbi:8-amino-7-oxononanoate synthase, partial [Pseudomonas aeruginosa]